MRPLSVALHWLFGNNTARSVFRQPGFSPQAWEKFEPVGVTLMEGFRLALDIQDLSKLAERLNHAPTMWRGIAYEGAGMGLATLDALGRERRRVVAFGAGAGQAHLYPFYVGVGLAYARLRIRPETRLVGLDPLLGWVTADGYGFHEAFFRRRRYVDLAQPAHRLTSYGQRMFDQGVGRALWFSLGADPDLVARHVAVFAPQRRGDVWAGVGLAAAYGGGAGTAALERLCERATGHLRGIGRGAAIAAWGREHADNAASHTELACQQLIGLTSVAAAQVVSEAATGLPVVSSTPIHRIWCDRIDTVLAPHLHRTHLDRKISHV